MRDGYVRSKRLGTVHKTKVGIFEKLRFLDDTVDCILDDMGTIEETTVEEESIVETENVITDNQEYYEVCIVIQNVKYDHVSEFHIKPKWLPVSFR